jgi:hypothetical protein
MHVKLFMHRVETLNVVDSLALASGGRITLCPVIDAEVRPMTLIERVSR